jgi:hypothetical protein
VYQVSHHVSLSPHWPELDWPRATGGYRHTLAVAEPIRRWVEQPCVRLRKRLHRARAAKSPGSLEPLRGAS